MQKSFLQVRPVSMILLLALALCPPGHAVSASKPPVSWSAAVQPLFGGRILILKGNRSDRYRDSLNRADRMRDALGASLLLSVETGKKTRLYTGLQFHNFGFTRKKENLKFLDTIHPAIGIMNDLSQTGGAYVDFNYRYMYLSIPLLFSRDMSPRKMTATRIHFTYGLSVSVLMKHDIRAVLHGFSTRGGVKEHIVENAGAEPNRFNTNVHSGIRIENRLLGRETWVFVHPEIIIPSLTANAGMERHRLFALALQAGIYYQPLNDSKK